jgi:hypothetical protein
MREFDRDFADEIVARLTALPADRTPRWGVMRAHELVPHLTHSVLWSMGRREAPAFIGNWATKNLIGPLIVNGWLPILKNVRIPIREGTNGSGRETITDLRAALDDYLAAVETGSIQTAAHPLFGDIGIDGWARMHVRHFQHHFKQFDL